MLLTQVHKMVLWYINTSFLDPFALKRVSYFCHSVLV